MNTKAGMEQHQYWSVPCNAWRRHAKGRPWDDAVESAEKQKDRRTARWNASHGNPGGAASGSKPAAAKKPEKKGREEKEKPWYSSTPSFWGLSERPQKYTNDPKSAIFEVVRKVNMSHSQVCLFFLVFCSI